MAVSYPSFGQLLPTAGGWRTEQQYGAFLKAEGDRRRDEVVEMDKFYASLAEQKREYDATLGFKEKELAQQKTLTEEEYALRRELSDEQIAYNKWRDEQYFAIENKKVNAQGMNYLGGPTSRDLFNAWQKNEDAKRGGYTRSANNASRFYSVDYSGEKPTLRPSGIGELSDQAQYAPKDYGMFSGVSDVKSYEELYG